jgi:hypothetical protein
MLWEVIAVIATIAVFILGRKLHHNYITAYVIGLIYGTFWEFLAEPLFTYSGFSIYLWRDVPLAILMLWGAVIAGSLLISDILQKKFKFKNKKWGMLTFDVLTITAVGWFLEYSGSHYLHMWTYTAGTYGALLLNTPLIWLLGWISVGLFVLTFIRTYGKLIKWY